MHRLKRALDFWGRADHQRRMNVVEAALQKARDRGRTKEELIAETGLSQKKVKTALRKLREKRRVEQDGARWRKRDVGSRGPKGK
jgi:transcription initiation factor IIE alpha subunit